jgi:hypothetical protein
MLAVSIGSASLDCLWQAAAPSPEHLNRCDVNLRHGLKGAAVAADLVKALGARRGNLVSRKVMVGNVNVEAGDEAVVGNVDSHQRSESPETMGAEAAAPKPKSRGSQSWLRRTKGIPLRCFRAPAAARRRARMGRAVRRP